MKRLAVMLTLLILMIAAYPANVARADANFDRIIKEGQNINEDVAVFGGNLVIEEGATVDGDVSVFGGVATLAGDIDGDVAMFGGSATLSGDVDGDLVLIGGSLRLDSSANVDGECILVGGTVGGDGASAINCTTVGDIPSFAVPAFVRPPVPPVPPSVPDVPDIPTTPRNSSGGFFNTIGSVASQSLVLGLLALLVASIMPVQLEQVSNTLAKKPAASGAVGLLTGLAGVSLIAILALLTAILIIVCIGLLGIPIIIALTVALAAGALLGWVAVGTLIGKRLAAIMNLTNRSMAVTAALGTAAFTLAAGLLGSLPFLLGGWFWTMVAILFGCAGLGAVALTRFGTRVYPPGTDNNNAKVNIVLETLPVEEEGKATGE
jgi:cytoskeletal protein CcmA (bactofilin family)